MIADVLGPCFTSALEPWYWLCRIGNIFYLTWERISTTCVVSVWRNAINCGHIFMFHLKNLTYKGLSRRIKQQCANGNSEDATSGQIIASGRYHSYPMITVCHWCWSFKRSGFVWLIYLNILFWRASKLFIPTLNTLMLVSNLEVKLHPVFCFEYTPEAASFPWWNVENKSAHQLTLGGSRNGSNILAQQSRCHTPTSNIT